MAANGRISGYQLKQNSPQSAVPFLNCWNVQVLFPCSHYQQEQNSVNVFEIWKQRDLNVRVWSKRPSRHRPSGASRVVSSSPEGIVSRDVILIFETAIVLQPSICFG